MNNEKAGTELNAAQWGSLYNQYWSDDNMTKILKGEISAQSTEMMRLSAVNDRVLEIGCGSGETTAYLSKNGRICTALDFQEESLAQTKAICARLGCDVRTVRADARNKLPFADYEFDIAFQAGLLEHFEREERVEMLRLWRPCCRKMISLIPNAACLGYRVGKALMEKSGSWAYGKELPQYSLIREFEEAGYRVTDEYTIDEKNALYFLPGAHYLKSALESWLAEMEICGDNCGQGYLLVTIGENSDCII